MRNGLMAALVCALLLLTSACNAERFFYTGTLTRTTRTTIRTARTTTTTRTGNIYMELNFSGGKVTGFYYDRKSCDLKKLAGSYDKLGKLTLRRYSNSGRVIGTFMGTLTNQQRRISGKLEETAIAINYPIVRRGSTSKNRHFPTVIRRFYYPFSLRAAAQYSYTKRREGKVNLQASYPQFLSPSAGWRALNAAIIAEIKEREADFVKKSRQPGAVIRRDWKQTLQYEMKFATPALASMRVLRLTDTGGAHPNTYITGANYLVSDKGITAIKLADFFARGAAFQQPLNDYLVEQINAEKKRRHVNNPIDKLTSEQVQSFTLCPRGITFIFQPSSVGTYAEGSYDLFIRFASTKGLHDLFTTEGVIGEMMRKGSNG